MTDYRLTLPDGNVVERNSNKEFTHAIVVWSAEEQEWQIFRLATSTVLAERYRKEAATSGYDRILVHDISMYPPQDIRIADFQLGEHVSTPFSQSEIEWAFNPDTNPDDFNPEEVGEEVDGAVVAAEMMSFLREDGYGVSTVESGDYTIIQVELPADAAQNLAEKPEPSAAKKSRGEPFNYIPEIKRELPTKAEQEVFNAVAAAGEFDRAGFGRQSPTKTADKLVKAGILGRRKEQGKVVYFVVELDPDNALAHAFHNAYHSSK